MLLHATAVMLHARHHIGNSPFPRRAAGMPRADGAPPPSTVEDDLRELIQGARLDKHHDALAELGAESAKDLEDVTPEQLRRIGFKELEIERLRKAMAAAAEEGTAVPRGSLLVKPDRGDSELVQDLLGGGRTSVSDFASLQHQESKLSKKCCCCTRRQLLIGVLLIASWTVVTFVTAATASVLVKSYMEKGKACPGFDVKDLPQHTGYSCDKDGAEKSAESGTECTVRCDEGYRGSSLLQAVTRCSAEGTWVGAPPICDAEECTQGTVIPHSSTRCSGYTVGQTCEFTCSNGFSAIGMQKCGLGGAPGNRKMSGGSCECEAGHYSFKVGQNEEDEHCLPLSMTLQAAGYDKDAVGLVTVMIRGEQVPADLSRDTLNVPAAASLSILGSRNETQCATVCGEGRPCTPTCKSMGCQNCPATGSGPNGGVPKIAVEFNVDGALTLQGLGGEVTSLALNHGATATISNCASLVITALSMTNPTTVTFAHVKFTTSVFGTLAASAHLAVVTIADADLLNCGIVNSKSVAVVGLHMAPAGAAEADRCRLPVVVVNTANTIELSSDDSPPGIEISASFTVNGNFSSTNMKGSVAKLVLSSGASATVSSDADRNITDTDVLELGDVQVAAGASLHIDHASVDAVVALVATHTSPTSGPRTKWKMPHSSGDPGYMGGDISMNAVKLRAALANKFPDQQSGQKVCQMVPGLLLAVDEACYPDPCYEVGSYCGSHGVCVGGACNCTITPNKFIGEACDQECCSTYCPDSKNGCNFNGWDSTTHRFKQPLANNCNDHGCGDCGCPGSGGCYCYGHSWPNCDYTPGKPGAPGHWGCQGCSVSC